MITLDNRNEKLIGESRVLYAIRIISSDDPSGFYISPCLICHWTVSDVYDTNNNELIDIDANPRVWDHASNGIDEIEEHDCLAIVPVDGELLNEWRFKTDFRDWQDKFQEMFAGEIKMWQRRREQEEAWEKSHPENIEGR